MAKTWHHQRAWLEVCAGNLGAVWKGRPRAAVSGQRREEGNTWTGDVQTTGRQVCDLDLMVGQSGLVTQLLGASNPASVK